MRLVLAKPDKVSNYENELKAIGSKVNDPDLFERIRKACLNRRAFLFEGPEGFTVLRPITGPAVLSWASYTREKADLATYQKEVELLSKEIGAKWIEFWTVRPGFKRVATKLGYTSREDTWKGVPVTVWKKMI